MFSTMVRRVLSLGTRRIAPVTPASAAVANVLLVGEGASPSADYLLLPYLRRQGHEVTVADYRFDPPRLMGFDTVVICRYLHSRWRAPLEQFRNDGGRIVYFMDDDLFDARALAGLPWRYRRKIRSLALGQRAVIERLAAEIWVSTHYLATKYRHLNPVVISPSADVDIVMPKPMVRLCYHGTASHGAEIEWLLPVFAAVQRQREDTVAEIFGATAVNRRYREIPRTVVIHPTSWPTYLAYTSAARQAIALAPLLPSPFNAARGATKFFDFTRMGAVGLYSNVEPYRGFIRDGVDGILLENDPELWIRTIDALADDPVRRERMINAARQRVMDMAAGSGGQ